jgi:SAM-dependent methyltransferase
MAFNPGLLDMVSEWARDYGIRPGAKMLDIGTSELFCVDDPESLNRLLAHFGATPYAPDELARMAERSFAGELFARAGLSYEAVDISPYPRTMAIDLNRGRLPFWRRGRYDLVTNCGTTEHVVNQLNAFQLIHDACKVGGLMYHGVPMAGDFSHGFISYHPKFFTRLQEVNGYEIIARWIWADGKTCSYDSVELAHVSRPFVAQNAWVHFVFRRQRKDAFVVPTDLVEDHMRIR